MKTIGIYIGKFQPPHRGHYNIYKKLKQISDTETYITTTDYVNFPDSPLSLSEKEQIWVRYGVPSNKIVKVENIYNPEEIIQRNSEESTIVVLVVDQKEEKRFVVRKGKNEKGKEVWLDIDGKPSFYQPYNENKANPKPSKEHQYILFFKVEIDNRPVSGENIRQGLTANHYTDKQKQKFFQWVFGWYDVGLYQLLVDRFQSAKDASKTQEIPISQPSPTEPTIPTPATPGMGNQMTLKERIKPIIRRMVKEYMSSSTSSTPQGDSTNTNSLEAPDAAQRRMDTQDARQLAQKKKGAAERELSSMQADLKWKEKDVQRKRRDELPAKRKEIDRLNKSIASGGHDTSSANLT